MRHRVRSGGLVGPVSISEQMKRNCHRFPPDFVFRLTPEEAESLTSQIARSNIGSMTFPARNRNTKT